jgi:hypothetical protein
MAAKKTLIPEDNRKRVLDHLKEIERDLAWLSRKTGIKYATLYYCLVREQFNITLASLEKINTALDTNF